MAFDLVFAFWVGVNMGADFPESRVSVWVFFQHPSKRRVVINVMPVLEQSAPDTSRS